MALHIIAAVDHASGFGKDGKIPWNFKEDFEHFKETTKGHVCVMGRYTYDDMLQMMKKKGRKKIKKILTGRDSYVISNTETEFQGAEHARSLSEVVEANADREIFVLGGEKLFSQAIARANVVHLTVIDEFFDCDRFFPTDFLDQQFTITNGEKKETSDGTILYFMEYTRK